jgi:riboflavin kinase/FMN adenylyltransferase
MLLSSKQIRGQGRGHKVGFPTINLVVPEDLSLDEGIYAVWVVIDGRTYKGALHYGAIPTFQLKDKTMEVHLIDITDDTVPVTEDKVIEIDVVERIRGVRKFDDAESLAIQIAIDIKNVNAILK